jgi:peptidoglycan/xylan/chitin deacetylase (PgdA/CDA1 family)
VTAGDGSCVLVLHRVPDIVEREHDVSWSTFIRLVEVLQSHTVATDLAAPVPASVTLTFDDATADHRRVASYLAERALPAVFFATVERVGLTRYLTAANLRELVSEGHVVGSHALHHRRFDQLSAREVQAEVAESKRRLEALVEHPVPFFAAPGGSRHPALARALLVAGYHAARSTRWGLYTSHGRRFDIPAIPVTEFTLRSGWVEHVLEARTLPIGMRCTALARLLAPAGVARRARRRLRAC